MPVRLIDIPNAPKMGPEVGMTQTPGLRSGFGGLAEQLQQEELPKGYFDGGAEGLAKIARAVGGTGEVFEKLASTVKTVAKNLTVNKANLQIDDYIAARRGGMAQMPEDQWLGHLLEGIPKLEKTLEGLNPSPEARREINQALMGKLDRARIDVVGEARHQLATNALGALDTRVARAMEAGDYLGAQTVVDRGVGDQVLSAEAGARRKQDILANAEQTKVGEMMAANPQAFLAQVEEKGGVEIPGYGKIAFEGPRKEQVLQRARKMVLQQRGAANDELDELVQGGRLDTEDQVRAWAQARQLPPTDADSHVAALTVVDDETPAGQARVLRARLEIGAGLAQVNAGSAEEKFAWQDRIRRELPAEERAGWQKLVQDRYSGAKTNPIEADLLRQNLQLMEMGLYGPLQKEPGEAAARANLEVLQKAEVSRSAIATVMQMKPNMTRKEAAEFFSDWTATDRMRVLKEEFYPRQARPAGSGSSGSPFGQETIGGR